MAIRNTPLQKANLVLAIFETFRRSAGDVLVYGNLAVVGAKHGLSTIDIDAGLEIGYRKGWLESLPDKSILLTEAGFSVLSRPAPPH